MALVLRPRSMWEGCDLGGCLLQAQLKEVYPGYLAVAAPLFMLCYATAPIAPWLPVLLIWIAKPWLDRTILFGLARALFGETTMLNDVWQARRELWLSQLPATLTLRRLSASRSFTQPIRQLEGLRGSELAARQTLLAARQRGIARMVTMVFSTAEIALFVSILSLAVWLEPHHGSLDWNEFLRHPAHGRIVVAVFAYAAAVAFLEPFYVAAGFGMYLNRRVELEAWDLEQEFRHAFGT